MNYVCNVLIVGHEESGKTSLCHRFTKNTFNEEYTCTKCVDFMPSKTVQALDSNAKLTLWDCAGKEEYRDEEVAPFIPTGNCICHVYDITSKESFESMKRWTDFTKELQDPKSKRFVIGLKADLAPERAVSREDAEQFSRDQGMPYMEASPKTGQNVEEVFIAIAAVYLDGFVGLWRRAKGPS